jgi:hypothetical protein
MELNKPGKQQEYLVAYFGVSIFHSAQRNTYFREQWKAFEVLAIKFAQRIRGNLLSTEMDFWIKAALTSKY